MNKKHITVVGNFVVDISVYSKKLPLPGETVIGDTYNIGPGGKGSNQAVAIAKAGGEVSLIARIGNDVFGKVGQKLYDDTGVKKTNVNGWHSQTDMNHRKEYEPLIRELFQMQSLLKKTTLLEKIYMLTLVAEALN